MNRSLKTALRVAGVTLALGVAGATGYVFAIPATSPEFVPRSFTYAGYLENDQGQPVPDGSVTLAFKLFDNPDGQGMWIWSSGNLGVVVDDGHFSVELGGLNSTPINPAWLARSEVYLEVTLVSASGSNVILGRQQLGSVPYALRAATAASASAAEGPLETRIANLEAFQQRQQRVAIEYHSIGNPMLPPNASNYLQYLNPSGENTGGYDSVTGTFTAPIGGCYAVSASLNLLTNPASAIVHGRLYVIVNGQPVRMVGREYEDEGVSGTYPSHLAGASTVCVSAGARIQISFEHQSTWTHTYLDQGQSRLAIVRVSE